MLNRKLLYHTPRIIPINISKTKLGTRLNLKTDKTTAIKALIPNKIIRGIKALVMDISDKKSNMD